jgi:2-polyprenyl-3-methyl-5-hydroxy-6-metoxy-1,4-benzoquinol methylase
MKNKKVYEPQVQLQINDYHKKKGVVLGPYTSHIWRDDPKHLLFLLARYKFCSKMLAGKTNVLEVGCGDSFGTGIVLQTVKKVHGIDIEPLIIEDNIKRTEYGDRCSYEVLDMTSNSPSMLFDGAFALDVIEHIAKNFEEQFMINIANSLTSDAICIIGTPNIAASQYASSGSAACHINLKSGESLKQLLSPHFENVFIFSMNDEVLHTGFYPMAHYLFGVGTNLKGEKNSKTI